MGDPIVAITPEFAFAFVDLLTPPAAIARFDELAAHI